MNQYLIVYEKFFDKCHTSPGDVVQISNTNDPNWQSPFKD